MYADGRGTAQDDKAAVSWYAKAAHAQYAPAQSNLGYMYSYGRGVRADNHEAMKWYLRAASQNYAQGEINLGLAYFQRSDPHDLGEEGNGFARRQSRVLPKRKKNSDWPIRRD